MKLLLEGSLVALVLVCELAGLVALATRYTETTPETYPTATAQESFHIVRSDDGGEAYRWVEWAGSSSCSVVWKVRRATDIVEANSSSFSESEPGGIIGEAEEDYRRGHIRPHLATSRALGLPLVSIEHSLLPRIPLPRPWVNKPALLEVCVGVSGSGA